MEIHIVEILVILLRNFPEGMIEQEEFEPLTEDLIGLGYTKQEIETALFWFYNRIENQKNAIFINDVDTDSYRVLHEVERTILTPEAYGFLIELRHLGVINLTEMDLLIEKSVLLGNKRVSLNDVKALVANSIFDPDEPISIPGRSIYLKTPLDSIQ